MVVRELLKKTARSIVTAPVDMTIEDAIALMDKEEVGALIVVKDGRPVGMFSTRDCFRLCLEKKSAVFDEITLGEAMINKLITAGPDDEFDMVMDMMLRAKIRYLPVIEDDRVSGMLNTKDMMIEYIRILEDELHRLKTYVDDLHKAGWD